ncbi:MAG: DegV family protein [Anaerolineae bacterium]
MTSIAVVTDTDASLPDDLAKAHGIRQVPINIHFGEEALQSGVDIDDATLFERVDREGVLPTTSAPTPGQFAAAYRDAFEAGNDLVLCFCVSAEVSGTYNSALQARDLISGGRVTVVDSRTISMGQGYMALAAAAAVKDGASEEEAVARAVSVRERTYLYAALDTLKYLAMSGRVGHLAAGMASVLGIKPILTLADGKLDLLEKVRTRRKAWRRVTELVGQQLKDRPAEQLAILYVGAVDEAQLFEAQLREAVRCPDEIIFADFTPGLSVHTGPGMVGVVVVAPET